MIKLVDLLFWWLTPSHCLPSHRGAQGGHETLPTVPEWRRKHSILGQWRAGVGLEYPVGIYGSLGVDGGMGCPEVSSLKAGGQKPINKTVISVLTVAVVWIVHETAIPVSPSTPSVRQCIEGVGGVGCSSG